MSESEGSDSSCSDGEGEGSGSECPVSEEWVLGALSAANAGARCELRHVEVRPGCGEGQAALSDVLAVSVRYRVDSTDAPKSADLVVKLLPRDPFSRFFVTEAQFDLREIKFYTEVVPDLEAVQGDADPPMRLPVPRCYHAHYKQGKADTGGSPEPPESALILEDVRPKGYKTASFSEGLTFRQVEAALSAIARVHALSLVLAARGPPPLAERYPFLFQSDRASDSYQQLLERGLPQLARFLRDRPELNGVHNSLEALRPRTRKLIETLLRPAPPMSVITHTDFWCNNLMFREKDGVTECCILDWQMVTLSRPTNDVALLLVSSVDGSTRRQRADELVQGYFEAVAEGCARLGSDAEGLGWERTRFARELRRSQLLALLLCLGSVDVALGDARAERRLHQALQDAAEDGLLDGAFIDEQLE